MSSALLDYLKQSKPRRNRIVKTSRGLLQQLLKKEKNSQSARLLKLSPQRTVPTELPTIVERKGSVPRLRPIDSTLKRLVPSLKLTNRLRSVIKPYVATLHTDRSLSPYRLPAYPTVRLHPK